MKVFITDFIVTSTYWGETTSKISVAPGDSSIPLTIIIDHRVDYPITSLTASLKLKPPFYDDLGKGKITSFYGNEVRLGETATFTFTLNLDSNAKIGTHDLTMIIDYHVKTEQGLVKAIPVEVPLEIQLLGRPEITITSVQDHLIAGATNDLTLTFTNTGLGEASSSQATLTFPTGVVLLGGSDRLDLKNIAAGGDTSRTLTLDVSANLAATNIQIKVAISYQEPYGLTRSQNEILGFRILSPESEAVDLSVNLTTLQSGYINDIPITLHNLGSKAISDLEILFSIQTGATLIGNSRIHIQTLEGGDSTSIPISLYVTPSKEGDAIQLQVSISYNDSYGATQSSNRIIGFKTIPYESPLIDITTSSSTIHSGEVNNLLFSIKNLGNTPITELKVEFSPPNSATLIGSSNFLYIEKIEESSVAEASIHLYVEPTTEVKVVQIQASISYRDSQGSINSYSRIIGFKTIESTSVSPIGIITDSSILTSGHFTKPTITLRNGGETPIASIEVMISSSNSLSITPGTESWYFESLEPNARKSLQPEVFASLGSKDSLQEVSLALNYLDSSGNWHEETRSITFTVKGSITLVFQGEQLTPSTISPGGNFTITGNIINKGNADALYADINLKANSDFRSTVGSQYIGDIPPNTPLPFSIFVAADRRVSEGTYPIIIIVSYEDDYGDEHVEELTMDVSVSGSIQPTRPVTETTTTGLTFFGAVFFLCLAAIVGGGLFGMVRVYRGKRKVKVV